MIPDGLREISRILAVVSAFFGLWTLIRLPKGLMGGIMWLPKLWAGAWASFLGIAGLLGVVLGVLDQDRTAILLGLFGSFAGIRYTLRVTRRREDPFTIAFGENWEQRIPPDLRRRMPRRYALIQPSTPSGPSEKDLDIGGASSLLCDLWFPAPNVRPTGLAVIFLHGSLWQALDKDFLSRPLFQRIVNQGHTVMDVGYSLAPAANLQKMLEEVKHSIAWLKTNAVRLNVDPARIVLMGSSGGAHLALLSAYTPNLPVVQPQDMQVDTSVRAVISIHSIADMTQFFHEYGETNRDQPRAGLEASERLQPYVHDKTAMDRLITRARLFPAYRYSNMPGGALLLVNLLCGTPDDIPDVYRLFSPITHVGPQCPPTLLMAGDNDFVIDISHSRRLNRALREAGVPCVYIEFPNTVHGFDQYFCVSRRIAPAAQIATSDIECFLALMV